MEVIETDITQPSAAAQPAIETDGSNGDSNRDSYTQGRRVNFALHLRSARTLWRAHRDLVEAEEMSEPYALALREDKWDPSQVSHGTCSEYECPICWGQRA
jgi:hypothetical protein